MRSARRQAVRTEVPLDEGLQAIREAAAHLRMAQASLARLERMENIRPENIHADSDYIRRVIQSLDARSRRLKKNGITESGKGMSSPS